MTRAGRDVVFEVLPVFTRKITRSAFGPVAPDVGSGSELFATPGCSHHRTAWHENDRNVDHGRAHKESWNGLVAAAHENGAVDGMSA